MGEEGQERASGPVGRDCELEGLVLVPFLLSGMALSSSGVSLAVVERLDRAGEGATDELRRATCEVALSSLLVRDRFGL